MSKKAVKKVKSKKKPQKREELKSAKVAKPGKLVEIEAKLPLTDRAKVERGEIAAAKLQERDRLVLERKSVANEYKAQIDALTSEATKLLLEFSEGREVRTVKAREVRDFNRRVVEYVYKDQVIHSRTMTLADQQEDLPLKESKDAPLPKVSAVETGDTKDLRPRELKTGETLQEAELPAGASVKRGPRLVAPTHDPVADAHAADEAEKRADLASVIKQETSVRGKWNSLDGVKE